jgi:hypothetical protein
VRENTTLYRTSLSAVGGLIIGGLGLVAGAAWGVAAGADVALAAVIAGAAACLWGMFAVQLTPTGGVIMENKTTVNYAVVALHCWIAAFACLVALAVWAVRAVLL